MFLIFWKSEPQRSYKHGSYKKKKSVKVLNVYQLKSSFISQSRRQDGEPLHYDNDLALVQANRRTNVGRNTIDEQANRRTSIGRNGTDSEDSGKFEHCSVMSCRHFSTLSFILFFCGFPTILLLFSNLSRLYMITSAPPPKKKF